MWMRWVRCAGVGWVSLEMYRSGVLETKCWRRWRGVCDGGSARTRAFGCSAGCSSGRAASSPARSPWTPTSVSPEDAQSRGRRRYRYQPDWQIPRQLTASPPPHSPPPLDISKGLPCQHSSPFHFHSTQRWQNTILYKWIKLAQTVSCHIQRHQWWFNIL